MNEKSKLWSYGVYTAVALIVSVTSACIWKLFSQTELLQVIRILADAFFLPGALFLGISLIGWIGSKGTFDIFGYSMRSLFSMFKRESYYKRQETFFDYRQSKDETRKPFNLPMLVVGLVFLTLGLIFTVVFLILE
ncbi:MAG: DUF3899 domain-containing protein [Clostridia bacterium]|nr:DUF3899 domain-containing protein [Clostridia bacterium]